jgi:hypothetical protein
MHACMLALIHKRITKTIVSCNSTLGQGLSTSTYTGEVIFSIIICVLGLLLFALLIGNMQVYNITHTLSLSLFLMYGHTNTQTKTHVNENNNIMFLELHLNFRALQLRNFAYVILLTDIPSIIVYTAGGDES